MDTPRLNSDQPFKMTLGVVVGGCGGVLGFYVKCNVRLGCEILLGRRRGVVVGVGGDVLN